MIFYYILPMCVVVKYELALHYNYLDAENKPVAARCSGRAVVNDGLAVFECFMLFNSVVQHVFKDGSLQNGPDKLT